ncbi:MAG: glycosyltransferase family 2 protein, partial [Gemmatimonadaceae bacterium]
MSAPLKLAVAVPIYNEEAVIPELLRRIGAVLDRVPGGPHQIVLVDDGSSDRSWQVLESAAATDARILALSLSRNFGHQAAVTAALAHAEGDAVVVMDGDLQDAPEAIPALLEAYYHGYDVVYAERTKRKEAWPLRLSYFLFYRLLARLSERRLPLDAGDFAVLSARVVNELRKLPEHHRYLRGLRAWVGFRQIGVPIERAERFAGRSKYGTLKLVKLAFDAIFAFSIVPLRAAAALGASAVLLAGAFTLYALYRKIVLD